MPIPGFHRRALVRLGEGGEDGVAAVDVGEVALDELSALERDNPNLRFVLTMTDDPAWEGETRRIDTDLLRDHLDGELDSFTYLVAGPPAMVEDLVAGPPAMVEAMEKTLREAAVPEEQIRPERFSGY